MPEVQRRFTAAFQRLLDKGVAIEVEVVPDWLLRPGRDELGPLWPITQRVYGALTGMALPEAMPPRERRRLDIIVTHTDGSRQIVEFDEGQHFTAARRLTLEHYDGLRAGFDVEEWKRRCDELSGRERGGGFARPRPPLFPGPGGRHRQRAFRDLLADIVPREHGWKPTVRFHDAEFLAAERDGEVGSFLASAWEARKGGVSRQ